MVSLMKINGSVLRGLRKQHNLSQEKLAEIIGVSTRTISFWECELKKINKNLMISLTDYFDVPVSMLTETNEDNELVSTTTLSRAELYQKENMLLEKLMRSFEQYAKDTSYTSSTCDIYKQTKKEW